MWYGGFLKQEYPQIIQVMDDHFSIETYGDLGIPHFQEPLMCRCWSKPNDI